MPIERLPAGRVREIPPQRGGATAAGASETIGRPGLPPTQGAGDSSTIGTPTDPIDHVPAPPPGDFGEYPEVPAVGVPDFGDDVEANKREHEAMVNTPFSQEQAYQDPESTRAFVTNRVAMADGVMNRYDLAAAKYDQYLQAGGPPNGPVEDQLKQLKAASEEAQQVRTYAEQYAGDFEKILDSRAKVGDLEQRLPVVESALHVTPYSQEQFEQNPELARQFVGDRIKNAEAVVAEVAAARQQLDALKASAHPDRAPEIEQLEAKVDGLDKLSADAQGVKDYATKWLTDFNAGHPAGPGIGPIRRPGRPPLHPPTDVLYPPGLPTRPPGPPLHPPTDVLYPPGTPQPGPVAPQPPAPPIVGGPAPVRPPQLTDGPATKQEVLQALDAAREELLHREKIGKFGSPAPDPSVPRHLQVLDVVEAAVKQGDLSPEALGRMKNVVELARAGGLVGASVPIYSDVFKPGIHGTPDAFAAQRQALDEVTSSRVQLDGALDNADSDLRAGKLTGEQYTKLKEDVTARIDRLAGLEHALLSNQVTPELAQRAISAAKEIEKPGGMTPTMFTDEVENIRREAKKGPKLLDLPLSAFIR